MRNTITVLWTVILVVGLGTAAAASAASSSKQENVGIGTGAIVGAVAGGPIGFIIGAAVGAKVGDSLHQKTESIDTLQSSLQDSRGTIADLESDVGDLDSEIRRLQTAAHPELVSLMQAGIDMDLLFRTDEFALTDTTGDRLVQMAETLSRMPGVLVQLDGFADERGDADYNYALSERRVEFVRNLFITAGVHPARIRMAAHGEAVAQDTSVDSLALERRVSVRLFIDGSETVAANPR